ncbi:hypothetical protein ACFLYB_05375 [Chloroflexota bacterium]
MSEDEILITQDGKNVTLSGFLGKSANILAGSITLDDGVWILIVSGEYPEDGGTTITSFQLYVNSESALSGDEDWSWRGVHGSCPDGKSAVTATRV